MVQLTMQLAHHTGTAPLHHAEIVAQGALEIHKKKRKHWNQEIIAYTQPRSQPPSQVKGPKNEVGISHHV